MKAAKQGITLLILVGFLTTGWNQSKLPIFKEKTDSIEYEKISLRMRERFTLCAIPATSIAIASLHVSRI